MRRRERLFAWLAVLGALLGGAGLVLLSIFDTKRHTSLHRVFLLVFMLGVALSALFSIVEYRWISKDFGGYRALRRAYIMKGIIAGLLIALAIGFAGALYGKGQTSTDAGGVSSFLPLGVRRVLMVVRSYPGMGYCLWLYPLPPHLCV